MNRRSYRIVLLPTTVLLTLGILAGESAFGADQISYTYDALGRLVTVAYPNNSTVTYAYDPAGNRTLVTNTDTAGSGSGTQTPQQRRKIAALQAILSILLGN
jgi:YD repeat-containing protein